eukprot:463962_1
MAEAVEEETATLIQLSTHEVSLKTHCHPPIASRTISITTKPHENQSDSNCKMTACTLEAKFAMSLQRIVEMRHEHEMQTKQYESSKRSLLDEKNIANAKCELLTNALQEEQTRSACLMELNEALKRNVLNLYAEKDELQCKYIQLAHNMQTQTDNLTAIECKQIRFRNGTLQRENDQLLKKYDQLCKVQEETHHELMTKREEWYMRGCDFCCNDYSNVYTMDSITDANDAGTTQSQHCALIVTDNPLALVSIRHLNNYKDVYGVYPFKGELVSVDQKHPVNFSLAQLLGLKRHCQYDSKRMISSLRYGKVLFMTDEDPQHLISKLFESEWPELLQSELFGAHHDQSLFGVFTTPISERLVFGFVHRTYYKRHLPKDIVQLIVLFYEPGMDQVMNY